ncbi:hypothetical protein E2C06_20190 [Dankookia rubra]|uniref:Uncharacterized protein n=1 Tax=Dankookia rubra TaxID=1442381 RepID=A0A4R5QDU4_9PROT|nr:hypothetical protein [Dankookia rubra]TDH60819.1 hypothetical protein E2C06_20190 [Dankookia rubra]
MGRAARIAPRNLYGYPDMVEKLEWAEAVLLCGLREWVGDLRRNADPMPRLHVRMTHAGVPLAAASLDMFLRIVARTADRPLGIGCPHCPWLATDEQQLLHIAWLVQDHQTRLAGGVLRSGLLSEIGAEFALGPLRGMGELFLAAGLAFTPRRLVGPSNVVGAGSMSWPPTLTTRH